MGELSGGGSDRCGLVCQAAEKVVEGRDERSHAFGLQDMANVPEVDADGLDGGQQLSLTLCDDESMQSLNSQWRSI